MTDLIVEMEDGMKEISSVLSDFTLFNPEGLAETKEFVVTTVMNGFIINAMNFVILLLQQNQYLPT